MRGVWRGVRRGRDDAGGAAVGQGDARLGRAPVGEVRAHSVKRVASAVGEGSVVVSEVHVHLSTPHG